MKVHGIDASYYFVADIARATEFYTWLIGSEPTMARPGMFSEWTFPGGESFGLYQGSDFSPSDGVMFAVDDVAAAVAACKARGVHAEDHIEDTPVCHMGFAKDTEGNGFILHKRK